MWSAGRVNQVVQLASLLEFLGVYGYEEKKVEEEEEEKEE